MSFLWSDWGFKEKRKDESKRGIEDRECLVGEISASTAPIVQTEYLA